MFLETIVYWLSHYGYVGLFTLLMFGIIGLPVPDETLLVYAGFLVYKGELSAVPTYLAAFGGSVCGITVSYLLGRSGGNYLVKRYGRFIRLTPEKIEFVHHWFSLIGKWFLILGYFFACIRHLTALVAGSSKLEWYTFAFFAYVGAFVWSASFVSIGWWLGKRWHIFTSCRNEYIMLVIAGVVAVIVVYVFIRKRFLAKFLT